MVAAKLSGKFEFSASRFRVDALGGDHPASLLARHGTMEGKKRKREDEIPPLVTYHALGRTFDRLFKG